MSQSPPEGGEFADAYEVTEADGTFKRFIPRRRSGDYSLPLTLSRKLAISDEFAIGDQLLSKFGCEQYAGCSNAEFPTRPIPEIFRTSETDKITATVVARLPALLSWLFRKVKAPYQSYTEVSRAGGPFYRPFDAKRWLLEKIYPAYAVQDYRLIENAFVQIGVRIQPEDLAKVRKFTFCSANGEIYKAEIDRRTQQPRVWGTPRYAGRTRQVFNQPIFNLLGQVLDTALNNVYSGFPAFHHDMTRASPLVKGPVLAFDVSHMERLTARIVYERARLIGGAYYGFQHFIRSAPFLIPSDDWSKVFFAKCRYDKGYSVQFGSGNSAVSPSQKDIFMVLYAMFAEMQLGVSQEVSFDWVAQGGDDRLRIFNFGDDNFVFSPAGDTVLLEDLYAFMSEYLTIGREDPPRFLGWVWDGVRFMLSVSSYLTKTYQNERAPVPPFRRFPNHGWVEKRRMYGRYGDPILTKEVFPLEDRLLEAAGAGWANVLEESVKEQFQLRELSQIRQSYFSDPNYLMDKADYLISHEEKVKVGAVGGYTGFLPSETATMLSEIIDPQWAKMLVL